MKNAVPAIVALILCVALCIFISCTKKYYKPKHSQNDSQSIVNTIIFVGYILPAVVLILLYKKLSKAAIEAIEKDPLPFSPDLVRFLVDLIVLVCIFCPILNLWFAFRGIKFTITRIPEK